MATLFICVWAAAAEVARGDPIQEMSVAIGVASAQSAALEAHPNPGPHRRRVRLFADVDCFVTWEDDPTALSDGTDGRPLQAGSAEYFDIQTGHRVAAIERT